MSNSLVAARIVRPFSATVTGSDQCKCGWPAYRHRLFGGVIAHPYRHVNHTH